MKIIVLDASDEQKIALLNNSKCVYFKQSEEQKADTFMKLVDCLFKENSMCIKDIDGIAVNVGPGSFTGIRVTVSTAKGLGFANKAKFIKFDSFDYFEKNQNIILTGFSNFVYLKTSNGEASCIEIDHLDKNLEYVVSDKNLALKLENLGFKVQVKQLLSFDKIDAIVNGDLINISDIRPLYLRKSQAEIQRENTLKDEK